MSSFWKPDSSHLEDVTPADVPWPSGKTITYVRKLSIGSARHWTQGSVLVVPFHRHVDSGHEKFYLPIPGAGAFDVITYDGEFQLHRSIDCTADNPFIRVKAQMPHAMFFHQPGVSVLVLNTMQPTAFAEWDKDLDLLLQNGHHHRV